MIGKGIIQEWIFKQRLRLAKNPYYWNAATVKSRTVEAVEVEYQNSAWMLLGPRPWP